MARSKEAQQQRDRRRVIIDFPTEEAAINWFNQARTVGLVPEDAALFKADALDQTKITPSKHLVVRGTKDPRPANSRVA